MLDFSGRRPRARAVQAGLIVLIVLTGAWLRIEGLADESVWHDEAHSALMARLDAFQIVRASATTDNHPPLYYLILHWFTQLAGADSETWLRAPSVAFGILGILCTFLVAKELGGRVSGLWAAALLAVSAFHIQHSREARMYSLLYAAATLNMYLFLKLRTGNSMSAALWIGCTLATLFAHNVGLFVVLAQHICWAVLRVAAPDTVPTFRKWLTLNVVVAFAAAPWAWVIVLQRRRMDGRFWVAPPYLSQPVDVLARLAGSFTLLVLLASACVCTHCHGHPQVTAGHSPDACCRCSTDPARLGRRSAPSAVARVLRLRAHLYAADSDPVRRTLTDCSGARVSCPALPSRPHHRCCCTCHVGPIGLAAHARAQQGGLARRRRLHRTPIEPRRFDSDP